MEKTIGSDVSLLLLTGVYWRHVLCIDPSGKKCNLLFHWVVMPGFTLLPFYDDSVVIGGNNVLGIPTFNFNGHQAHIGTNNDKVRITIFKDWLVQYTM